MPRPNEPWIALEIGALETYASLIPEGEETPICLTFPNVFTVDENDKVGRLCDIESLADVDDERAFTLDLSDVKMGKDVYVPGTDLTIQVDLLLRSLFSKIRIECEKRYFSGRPISTCYILAREQHGFFKALESAATTAGIENVEFRRKAECVVQAALEEGKRFENNVVFCDASYGLTSLTLLAPVGDGYARLDSSKGEKRQYLGYDYVAEKIARIILNIPKNEKPPLNLVLRIIAVLKDAPDEDGVYRIKYGSKKYKLTRAQVELLEKGYLEKLSGLFKGFFAEVDDLVHNAPYEIVLVGVGSKVSATSQMLKKFAKPSTKIWIEGARNSSFDWTQILLSTEVSPKKAKPERQKAAKAFLKAQNENDVDACLELAERYFTGNGALCLREEAFYWLSLAARRGSVDALYRLGKCYECGFGVRSDLARAFETYKQAAQEGHPKAQYKMACRCVDYGQDEQARYWLELSIKQGYKKAVEKFEKLNYKTKTIAHRINLARTREKAKGRRESVIGAFLSSLVFFIGAIYVYLSYADGDRQKFAASLAALVLIGCALAIVIVGSCLLLKYLNNAR